VSGDRVLLVTGAAGLVGSDVAGRVLADGSFARVLALVRRPPDGAPPPGVRVLVGDVRAPGLGLDADAAAGLRDVTHVLHAAADTRFGRPLDEARRTNVDGTRHALDVAARCPRLEAFLHASTVHVAGLAEGPVPEAPIEEPPLFANTYQRSKHEAEALVRRRWGSLPASIARLTTAIGDSRTGEARRLNHVHGLVRLLPLRLSDVAAYDPEARVDVLATDATADAVAALLGRAFRPGEVFHVCAGARAPTIAALHEEIRRAYAERGVDVAIPQRVPIAVYRARLAALRAEGHAGAVRILEGLERFLPHLRVRQRFEDERTTKALSGLVGTYPPPLETFGKVVRWGVRTEWGARPVARSA
jgi:nucleoside-diphosphate-sugar epimerase